jgi:hypothetical protein
MARDAEVISAQPFETVGSRQHINFPLPNSFFQFETRLGITGENQNLAAENNAFWKLVRACNNRISLLKNWPILRPRFIHVVPATTACVDDSVNLK